MHNFDFGIIVSFTSFAKNLAKIMCLYKNSSTTSNKNELWHDNVFEEVVSPVMLKVQRKRAFTNQLQQPAYFTNELRMNCK